MLTSYFDLVVLVLQIVSIDALLVNQQVPVPPTHLLFYCDVPAAHGGEVRILLIATFENFIP